MRHLKIPDISLSTRENFRLNICSEAITCHPDEVRDIGWNVCITLWNQRNRLFRGRSLATARDDI
jgi:hypothetical protein